ncbi:hypothetical protein ACFQZE_24425 [Paenibacillus sp. GCM10027627]|uniref:hypothetical protein n=1 Tax=unclassified Paenibacillus TaxID=185978 RepID=UPI00364540A9
MNYNTNTRETISFRATVAPGATIILQERVKAPGTVETVNVRFYRGQQLALRVNPYIEHKGRRTENVITYAETTRKWLSGDDDYFNYDVVFTVDYDDYVKVWAYNTDPANAYDVVVDITIDYFGGTNRVVG